MHVKIEIKCDTVTELIGHLLEIIYTVKNRSRGNPKHDFEVGTHFLVSNSEGEHEVTIEPQ